MNGHNDGGEFRNDEMQCTMINTVCSKYSKKEHELISNVDTSVF